MKYLKYTLLFSLMFAMGTLSYEADAQRRATKKEIRARKVAKRNRVIRRHHRVAHYRYRNLPRWGYRVTVVPTGATVIVRKGIRYRYYKGVYYRPVANRFVVVAPPRGIRVRVLPAGYKRIVIAGRSPVYYYYGTYYSKRVEQGVASYETIEPPAGAQVDALPEGYEEQEIDGHIYYVLEDQYYKEVVTGSGDDDVYYELVDISTLG